MKKIISTLIITFVFAFIITAGVLIVETGWTNDTSNAKLIEGFMNNNNISTELADADAEVTAQPEKKITPTAEYIAPIEGNANSTATNEVTIQSLELQAVALIREQMALQQTSH